jgi:hypothetical protein
MTLSFSINTGLKPVAKNAHDLAMPPTCAKERKTVGIVVQNMTLRAAPSLRIQLSYLYWDFIGEQTT